MTDTFGEQVKAALLNRLRLRALGLARHYRRLFKPTDDLSRDAQIVLADLRDFARMNKSGFSTDALMMARWQGRREAVLRILDMIDLDPAQVRVLMELDSD